MALWGARPLSIGPQAGPAPDGVLLTFDDGLRDHRDFVLPVLQERGLFGLFYVPSGPAITGRILDVHKVHLAVGRMGGRAVLTWLEANTPELLSHAAYEDADGLCGTEIRCRDKTSEAPVQLAAVERGASRSARCACRPCLRRCLPRWDDFYLDRQAMRGADRGGNGRRAAQSYA